MSQFSVIGMGDTFSIVDECDVEVASVPYEHENGVEATDSPEYRRAVLFAHAPELLAALEGIIRQNTDVIQAYRDVIGTESEPAWIFDLRESTTEARAAIRAAKGEGTDDQSGDSITSTRFKD